MLYWKSSLHESIKLHRKRLLFEIRHLVFRNPTLLDDLWKSTSLELPNSRYFKKRNQKTNRFEEILKTMQNFRLTQIGP
jgi:hypothetical protein